LANIPPKQNRKAPICFSPYLYRATQSGRAAANYLNFIKLASIRIWLRAYEFTP
jgi:hypothetical protein